MSDEKRPMSEIPQEEWDRTYGAEWSEDTCAMCESLFAAEGDPPGCNVTKYTDGNAFYCEECVAEWRLPFPVWNRGFCLLSRPMGSAQAQGLGAAAHSTHGSHTAVGPPFPPPLPQTFGGLGLEEMFATNIISMLGIGSAGRQGHGNPTSRGFPRRFINRGSKGRREVGLWVRQYMSVRKLPKGQYEQMQRKALTSAEAQVAGCKYRWGSTTISDCRQINRPSPCNCSAA